VEQRPLKVLIAGAGIGGLVLAVSLMKKGIDVAVFERDFTAIRGEGKYRGPIQVGASHALPHATCSMPGWFLVLGRSPSVILERTRSQK
jgi:2-polyprenyl-6-methoxyphenol hydroxylase-like FAD-dependent oxidoreductase